MTLTAGKNGYRVADVMIDGLDEFTLVKLTPASPLRIKGTVTDAATGQPIETFVIVPMVEPGNILLLDQTRAHHGGGYVFSEAPNAQPYRIWIEAKGYLAAVSPEYQHDSGEQVFDARLNKGQVDRGSRSQPRRAHRCPGQKSFSRRPVG